MDPHADAPEQTIRRWLDEHGPVSVTQEAIAKTWGLETLKAGDRRRIDAALEEAGVVVQPSLRRAGRRDKLELSVAEAEPAEVEPAAVAAEEQPLVEPAADAPAEEDPAPEPDDEPAADPGPSRALRLAPLAIALMVIGSLGPWAKDIFVVDHGVDRNGYLVIAAAAAAGLLLLLHDRRRRRSPLPLLAAGVATATLVLLAGEYRDLVDDQFVAPAWGIYAAFAGTAGLIAVAMALLVRR